MYLGGPDADPTLTLEDRRESRVYGTEKFNVGHVESEAMRCQREMPMEMLMEMLMMEMLMEIPVEMPVEMLMEI